MAASVTDAYPLQCPEGWPRTESWKRKRGQFASPARHLPRGPQWLYEPKLDGWRCQAVKAGRRAALYTPRGNDLAKRLPPIAAAVAALPCRSTTLDGELVTDLALIFEKHGANVQIANSLQAALEAVEADGLSAAILDHRLGRDDSEPLYVRLQARGIPFAIHSGYSNVRGVAGAQCPPLIRKPATVETLLATVERLLNSNRQPLPPGSLPSGQRRVS
jgi:hypothetical protein